MGSRYLRALTMGSVPVAVTTTRVAAIATFAVIVVLVGIVFIRFNPYGDLWEDVFKKVGINPWLALALFALGAAVVIAFRWSLLQLH
jgi:hypothetical protein